LNRAGEIEVKQMGAKNLSLFHRLGITLVIVGMLQSLAPTCLRPTRCALHFTGRLHVDLPDLGGDEVASSPLVSVNGPTLPVQTDENQESDQESRDIEDPAEAFAWSEAMTDRRSGPGSEAAAPLGSITRPVRTLEQTRRVLQRSRALSILATASSNMTTRLCRLTC
jgi:hypothetical protein